MRKEPTFDKIAWIYDFLKYPIFGKAIEESQNILIPFIPAKAKVLIIGGGTGKLLPKILQQEKGVKITYMELSEQMIKAARKRLRPEQQSQVDYMSGKIDVIVGKEFDVIITLFVLDMYSQEGLKELMRELDQLLKKNGLWLFADFDVISKNPIVRKSQLFLVWLMYRFFALTTSLATKSLPDYSAAF